MIDYAAFLDRKFALPPSTGIKSDIDIHPSLFDFQADLARWALRRGRCAVFADTGLGKTRIQVEWARHVADHTGQPVLILAPLAVGAQTVVEAGEIGVNAARSRVADPDSGDVVVTNYDRLHHVDPTAFGGVVIDESSIIKHHDAKTFGRLCDAFAATPFRLACTATPAPNDWTELGTHAEFLGVRSRSEMLAEFFVHDGGSTQDWRIKGHARDAFWRWVASWGAVVRCPSDLGYDGSAFRLPPIDVIDHVVADEEGAWRNEGFLFAPKLGGLADRRRARRTSVGARVGACAARVAEEADQPWIVWCELNREADALVAAIPGAAQIAGSDHVDDKEKRLVDFAEGRLRVLVTKPKIAGWGLNWQHCARVAFVGVTDSWESYYQAVRRCWRFGQARPVEVHVFSSELEGDVVANLRRKEADAADLSSSLAAETAAAVRSEVRGQTRESDVYDPQTPMEVPTWLTNPA